MSETAVATETITKRCSKCAEVKPFDGFWPSRTGRTATGLMSQCKSCASAASVAWCAQNREKRNATRRPRRRVENLNRRFCLTLQQYDAILHAQGGVCAICGGPEVARHQNGRVKRLAVDHDHGCCGGRRSCGMCVRGLLCGACNVLLGRFESGAAPDSPLRDAMVDYLESHRERRLLTERIGVRLQTVGGVVVVPTAAAAGLALSTEPQKPDRHQDVAELEAKAAV